MVPLMSTVARWFVKRRNIMGGVVMAGTGVGALIGPPLVNYLISSYDWRSAYLILGITIFLVVVISAQFMKRDPAQMGQRPYGEDSGEELQLGLDSEGFSLREAVRTRQLWLIFSIVVCVSFYGWSVQVHIAPHAIGLGISAATAANILATMGGVATIGLVMLGALGDRIGIKPTLIIGFAVTALSLFRIVPATEAWTLYMFVTFFGLFSRLEVLLSPLIARIYGLRAHGLIFGACNLGSIIGAGFGPILMGHIYDVMDSYQVAFLVCAAFAILGIILTLLLRPTQKRKIKNA